MFRKNEFENMQACVYVKSPEIKKSYRKAFTLAEVLVTLTVIGVVSAYPKMEGFTQLAQN